MQVKIKTFGVARDIMGSREVSWSTTSKTVGELKDELQAHHPALKHLNSLFVAVNHAYAPDDQPLAETDEVALIPPVSGG